MQEPTMSGQAGAGLSAAERPAIPHPVDDSEKGIAAVAYILTWITGLIIFFVAKKEQRYARWNAIQAIGLGIALFVLSFVFSVLGALFAVGGMGMFGPMAGLGWIVWLLGIVLIIISAVKAYQGTPLRLPLIADFADRNA